MPLSQYLRFYQFQRFFGQSSKNRLSEKFRYSPRYPPCTDCLAASRRFASQSGSIMVRRSIIPPSTWPHLPKIIDQLLNRAERVGLLFSIDMPVITFTPFIVNPNHPLTIYDAIYQSVFIKMFRWLKGSGTSQTTISIDSISERRALPGNKSGFHCDKYGNTLDVVNYDNKYKTSSLPVQRRLWSCGQIETTERLAQGRRAGRPK